MEGGGGGGGGAGHTWEWVGAKRAEGGERQSETRYTPFSDDRVSLQNVSNLILSHFLLAPSIFPSFNTPPPFSYLPLSLILSPSPSSPSVVLPYPSRRGL